MSDTVSAFHSVSTKPDQAHLRVESATGYGERVAALAMLDEHLPDADGISLGADAGYDTADFVLACRERGVTPHVAQTRDKRRHSAVDGRTARHAGYEISQRIRKRVEEISYNFV